MMDRMQARQVLYDHFPDPDIFEAVERQESEAEALLANEIRRFTSLRPTKGMMNFYRRRVETWLRLYGLDWCQDLSREFNREQ